MPRKKNKDLMTFTKVKKKTVENKRANMEKVRDLIDQYTYVYVFHAENFRNPLMKALKREFEFNGRFFMGKVKPTMVALGRNATNEYRENLRFVSNALLGSATGAHRGLFFTNNGPDKILEFFAKYKKITYAKTGFVATEDCTLAKGELKQFVFSQEYVLKKLGLPVLLKEGRILLNQNYIVCEEGQPLKPEQCKLLELIDRPMAEFRITVHGYWTNKEFYECLEEGKVSKLNPAPTATQDDETKEVEDKPEQTTGNFLDAFVGDESSDEDEDIKDIV